MYPINRVAKVKLGDDYEFMVVRQFVKGTYSSGFICEDANGGLAFANFADIQFVDGDAAKLLKNYEFPLEPIQRSRLDSLLMINANHGSFYCKDKNGKDIEIVDSRIKVKENVDEGFARTEIPVFYDSEGNEYLPGELYWEVKDDGQRTSIVN